jgi:hypothetical protein
MVSPFDTRPLVVPPCPENDAGEVSGVVIFKIIKDTTALRLGAKRIFG